MFARRSAVPASASYSVIDDRLTIRGEIQTDGTIRIDGRVEGVVAAPLPPTGDEGRSVLLLERLAQAVAVALDNRRALEFEHRTAVTLQRRLLPSVLPEPTGLSLAARYRASQQRMEVGGDFYDAFEVEGRCWLVIGDVQGHSLEAAVVMAELRYSLRAYAHEGHSPTEALARLDALLARTSPDLTATACVVVVDVDRRSAEVVSAGHLPPLRARRGEVTHLQVEGPLLGLGLHDRPRTRIDLDPGDRLVLYADGLVERRALLRELTTDHLVRQVESASWASADELADELLRTWSGGEDDIALLVVDLLP
jgi:serine phosphatase RsbU (regulator of sigma subunit)